MTRVFVVSATVVPAVPFSTAVIPVVVGAIRILVTVVVLVIVAGASSFVFGIEISRGFLFSNLDSVGFVGMVWAVDVADRSLMVVS